MKFIIGDKEWQPGTSDFPILLHGLKGSGASYFSISLISSLFLNNHRVLFFTLRPDAGELFEKQIGEAVKNTVFLSDQAELKKARYKQGILVNSGNEELCRSALRDLPKDDRVVFIKNVESLLDEELLSLAMQFPRLILSGDFRQSEFLASVAQTNFSTKIYFSPFGEEKIPDLPKRQGHIVSLSCRGVIQAIE
jgi:hypothetical protein